MRAFRTVQFAFFAALMGSSSAYAAPSTDTTVFSSLEQICRQTSVNMESCVAAACGSLSAAQTRPESEQRALGRQIASIVRVVGEYDAASGDKIMGCVAAAGPLVVASFEGDTDDSVADIGILFSASPQ